MSNFKQFYQGDTPAFRFEFKAKDGSALPEGITAVFVIASKCGTDVFRNEKTLDETGKTDFRIPKTVSDALKPGEYRWGVSLKYNAANADNADWQTPEGNGKLFVEANAAFPGADGASNAPVVGVFDDIEYEVNAYQGIGTAVALPDYIVTNLSMDTSNRQSVTINTTWWYKETEQEKTFPVSIQFASATQPGIMPWESFVQIETFTEAVKNVAKLFDVADALKAANDYTDNQILAVRNSTLH